MVVIIKKGENVNHAGSDDAEKNSLDNDCHHQKGGECEYMNIGF